MIKKIFFLILGILLISFASASFDLGNSSINEKYSGGSIINGWIEIGFSNENANSVFSDSNNRTASIIDVIKSNDNYSYTCTPSDCSSDYTPSNSQQTKTFTLKKGQTALVGLNLNKNIQSIDSISFNIESSAQKSCLNQFYVDIFNDNVIDLKNSKTSTDLCSSTPDYGCFDLSRAGSANEYLISDQYFCQKFNISESSGINAGVWIKKSGSRNLTVDLRSADDFSNQLAKCYLPTDAPITEGELSCTINYPVEKLGEYYVCVYSNQGAGNYYLRGYSTTAGCAFSGVEVPEQTPAAYQISIKEKKFGEPGKISYSSSDITEQAGAYLMGRYGSLDCLGKNCIIPIKITARENQNITLKNLAVSYYESLVGKTTEKNFYDLSEIAAKVNSDKQMLFIDGANFTAPNSIGNYTFKLNLDNQNILSKSIYVEAFPTIDSVTPTRTASAYPTKFKAVTNSTISFYSWDFGDNTTALTTNVNEAEHTYSSTGNYTLTINAVDNDGRTSSGEFAIIVDSPVVLIANLIQQDKNNINYINNLGNLDQFTKDSIFNSLNLNASSEKISELEIRYNQSSTDEEYNEILTELLQINIPERVMITASSPGITFYPKEEFLDFKVKPITGENYSDDRFADYSTALYAWNQENANTKVSMEEWSELHNNQETPFVKIFDVSITVKNSDEPYIVIKKLENISFAETYNQKEDGDYIYIGLKEGKNSIKFSTTEDIAFTDLPMFISPNTDKLPVEQLPTGVDTSGKKWMTFGLIIVGLILAGIIVYVVMQRWYKRKYENSLFKNKNNLYNIMNYITNSKEQGMDDKDIISNLRKSKWTNEQINYAMNKYKGKKIPGIINSESKSQKKQ